MSKEKVIIIANYLHKSIFIKAISPGYNDKGDKIIKITLYDKMPDDKKNINTIPTQKGHRIKLKEPTEFEIIWEGEQIQIQQGETKKGWAMKLYPVPN